MFYVGRPEPANLSIFQAGEENILTQKSAKLDHILLYICNKIVRRTVKIAWQAACLRPLICWH